MRTMYIILAVTGWAWFVLVAAYMAVRVWRERRSAAQEAPVPEPRPRGFDVVGVTERHDTQQ